MGNLYIAESQGYRIRFVAAQSGMISTVAGIGTSGFGGDGGPATTAKLGVVYGIALDQAGDLYIADMSNNRVRRVDAVSKVITTVAGNGTNAFTADGAVAASSSLAEPFSVAFDLSGGLLISEFGAYRVRRVDPVSGILTTVAGNGTAGFTGDGVPATSAGIGLPTGLSVDPTGNLFVGDGTGRVRRVDAVTGWITTVAGNGTGAQGQAAASAGSGGGGIPCYSRVIGDNGPATSATLDAPIDVLLTFAGGLLISDEIDCRVRLVDLPSPLAYTNTVFTTSATVLQSGQQALLTATVSPIGTTGVPTGTVQFVDESPASGATAIGTAVLNGGTASMTMTSSQAGGVMAIYSGDSSFNGSGSPETAISLSSASKIVATIALSASQSSATTGTSVLFTATVTAPAGAATAPSGPVLLYDGSALVATANLSNGVATLPDMFTTSGSHSMTAAYLGSNSYSQVFSTVLTETVSGSNTISIASGTPSATYGQTIQFTVSVVPPTATGTIQLIVDGSAIPGSAALTNGTTAIPVSTLTAGSHTVAAAYSGDGNNPPGNSAPYTQNVAQATPSLTLTSSLNPSIHGQLVTFTLTMSPVDSQAFPSLTIENPPIPMTESFSIGQTTVTGTNFSAGAHTVTGSWAGDANVLPGSTVLIQTVQATPTTTALSASPNPSAPGDSVILTATVTPASATGTLQFLDGATTLGTATVSAGSATLTLSGLSLGMHSITAVYSGDAYNAASTSAVLSQTVNKIVSSVALTSSPSPSTFAQSVSLSASLTPTTATGTVQFLDGSASLGTVTIGGGSATLSLTTLAVGAHSITAVYSGDTNDAASTSAALSQTVNKIVSTLALTSSPNPSTSGQSVNLAATVTPSAATGAVQFLDGATALGTVTINGGAASLSLTTLAVGAHSITAVYSGDTNDAASTSAVLPQTVNKIVSIMALTTSPNPSTSGQSVTLSATVTPSAATGTVQFLDGSTSLGTVTISGGAAALSLMTLAVGAHSITAVYSGDTNDATSTSAALSQTVNKTVSSVTLASSVNPSTYGQSATLSATVSPTSATGTIQFLDGSTSLGTATVASGSATLSLTTLAVGTHSITSVYSGDANDATSTSAIVSQTVNKVASGVALTTSPNPSTSGQSVTLSATVAPTTATGTIQFLDGSASLGTVTITGGAAALSLTTLSVGTHSITAVYSGDANDATATSTVVAQTVNKVASSVALTSSANPSTIGHSVTFAATVTPTTATGTVQFLDGSTSLGTAAISGGAAALSLTTLSVGTHSITAVYSGDANDATATSTVVAQTVNKVASSVALTSSANPSTIGHSVTFAAAVTPTTATGTVQFLDGSTSLGTVTISGGAASLSLTTLAVGTHSITAVYSGDANDAVGTSAVLTETVGKIASSLALTSSLNPSTFGQSVTLSAKVTPSTATGSVQFLDGSNSLGTVAISGGSAALSLSTLAAGSHSITAAYSGDSSDAASTSTALAQTVNKAATTVALASSKNPQASGSSVTFTASVSPTAATGSVEFLDGTAVLGTVTLSGGKAALSLSTLSVGAHSIKAIYSGDGNYLTSTSAVLTQSITGAACHVTYGLTNQWTGGFGTAITIQNTGTAAVNGWSLTWTWAGNQKITQSWNSTYSQTGANAKLTNQSYNAAIAAGATLTGIGFNASYSGTNTAPTAFSLNGTLCK